MQAKSLEHHAKISISLLRYVGDLPADKLFHQAGMACKDMGWQNLAFVFLNRYLDLSEAIEDGERTSGGLDNSDFQGTEIPYDYALPMQQFLDEDQREEVIARAQSAVWRRSAAHTLWFHCMMTRPCVVRSWQVRDWVLQLSMEGSVLQSLSEDTEIPFVRENLRLEDTSDYWRVMQTDYDVPAGPVAPMILKGG